ncbi:hypothetical protein E2542_SST29500 [Spatholobus suberectus]|nr:hypothetical protein E2542_SST29500 [Spatholobus suberectus]
MKLKKCPKGGDQSKEGNPREGEKGTLNLAGLRVQGLSIPAPTLKTLVEDANTSSNPKRHLVPLLVTMELSALTTFMAFVVLQNPFPPAKLSRHGIELEL